MSAIDDIRSQLTPDDRFTVTVRYEEERGLFRRPRTGTRRYDSLSLDGTFLLLLRLRDNLSAGLVKVMDKDDRLIAEFAL